MAECVLAGTVFSIVCFGYRRAYNPSLGLSFGVPDRASKTIFPIPHWNCDPNSGPRVPAAQEVLSPPILYPTVGVLMQICILESILSSFRGLLSCRRISPELWIDLWLLNFFFFPSTFHHAWKPIDEFSRFKNILAMQVGTTHAFFMMLSVQAQT